MKRFHILCFSLLAFVAVVAVGYSDSHVIKKDTIQDHQELLSISMDLGFTPELPTQLVVDAPDLGQAASNYIMVSEKLTDVFVMRIRPPPENRSKNRI